MNEKYMYLAIKEAKKALKKNEMPVGAVIIKNNKVIGKGYNKKEITKNALMHAEIIAIKKACKKNKDWRLENCEMYVTMEPCIMCTGAIIETRIKKVYCGIRNNTTKEITNQIYKDKKIEISFGILEDEILKLINTFFGKIRKNK